ncbi:heterokaryon incompatibility protein-domain-containing protein, partial [Cercophora newfieldiana]
MAPKTPYTPLSTKGSEIRVLTLLPSPGEPDRPIQCRLRVVSLNNNPEYEALSYVWGNTAERKPIEVDGCEMQVTTNLEAALRRLRHATHERYLWVDALCIDQDNVEEKETQIPLMEKIYTLAAPALIWLGETTSPDLDAFFSIANEEPKDRQRRIARTVLCFHPWERRKTYAAQAFCGMMELVSLPYWSRMWTIQEFWLP